MERNTPLIVDTRTVDYAIAKNLSLTDSMPCIWPFDLRMKTSLRADNTAQAFPELRCTFGGRSLVPDITVFWSQRIPRDRNGDIANTFQIYPDWTIEILSPNQSHTKVVRNILHCIDYGTEMGWMLDPEERCIFVYGADQPVQVLEDTDRVVLAPTFAQSVQLTAGEIFGWLQM